MDEIRQETFLIAEGWNDFVESLKTATNPAERMQFLREVSAAIIHCEDTYNPSGSAWYNEGVDWAIQTIAERQTIDRFENTLVYENVQIPERSPFPYCECGSDMRGKEAVLADGFILGRNTYCSETCLREAYQHAIRSNARLYALASQRNVIHWSRFALYIRNKRERASKPSEPGRGLQFRRAEVSKAPKVSTGKRGCRCQATV